MAAKIKKGKLKFYVSFDEPILHLRKYLLVAEGVGVQILGLEALGEAKMK